MWLIRAALRRPVTILIVIVGVAYVLDRGIDRLVRRLGRVIPAGVYDEDA